jgi:superfamily II DNA or RNA helicase
MKKDFAEYSNNNEKFIDTIHEIYQGKEKNSKKSKLYISTWQSIYTLPEDYFEQFDFIIGDEAHSCKAKSITGIIGNCVNAKYRLGTTGTLDGTQTHKLVLEGLFGPVFQSTTTIELIEKGQLSDFIIKCLILKHSDKDIKESKGWDYQQEMDFLVSNEKRNNFIKNLTLSLEGNSLVLFQYVEKHGKILFEMIKEKANNRKVFFVYGKTDVEARESVRAIVEKESNAIIVASYGVYSTGVNIRNLHNIIFASPSKARIRNLQSIGRGLRLGEKKTKATLYDISDDMRSGKKANHTLKHFIERVKIYEEQKFKYKFYNIELK